jgi:hypothetical protein
MMVEYQTVHDVSSSSTQKRVRNHIAIVIIDKVVSHKVFTEAIQKGKHPVQFPFQRFFCRSNSSKSRALASESCSIKRSAVW